MEYPCNLLSCEGFKFRNGVQIKNLFTIAEMRSLVKKQLNVIEANTNSNGSRLQCYSKALDWFGANWWNQTRYGEKYGGQWHLIYDEYC